MKNFIILFVMCFVTLLGYGKSNVTMSVDMGTSVKWANTTMAGFYRYGELTPVTSLGSSDESSYRFYSSLTDNMSWTYTNKKGATTTQTYDGGFADVPLDIAGNSDYDVATTLGEGWRLPTTTEYKELVDSCTIKRSADDNYWIITSNKTGKVIVLENVGYITYIGEHKTTSFHIMAGQTAIAEPRKYMASLVLSSTDDGEGEGSVWEYVSLDKVTSALPIWPVYTTTPRTHEVRTYNANTGDVRSDMDGIQSVTVDDSQTRVVKYYVSTDGVVKKTYPTKAGAYIVVYSNGDNTKILVK